MRTRGALVVVAAESKKQEPMDPAVKRAKLAVERRMRNKSRKSAIATRTKKVVKLSETLVRAPVAADAPELKQIEQLVSEAYTEIDKAVKVGTLHKNTGDRRKARVAKYKRQALIAAGAYVPTPEQPGYSFYQRMQAKTAKADAAH